MRKIIITSNKFIPSKGIEGPVLTPYMETKKEICKMLARGIEVEEVLSNGEHRKLDIPTALESDNGMVSTIKSIEKKVETINVITPKSEVNTYVNINDNNVSRKDKKDKKKNKKRELNVNFEVDTFEMK